jgi:sporulation protein YlmC with PRC-barrel domain
MPREGRPGAAVHVADEVTGAACHAPGSAPGRAGPCSRFRHGSCSFMGFRRKADRMGYRRTMSASSLTGDKVINDRNEDLGRVEDLMLDVETGRVAYAVLSFGGFLGMGDKLFAVPWTAMRLDEDRKCFVFGVAKHTLESAPGFDKDHWPDLSSEEYARAIHSHFGQEYPT